MRAMLDELMGENRNGDREKYGFLSHKLLTITKMVCFKKSDLSPLPAGSRGLSTPGRYASITCVVSARTWYVRTQKPTKPLLTDSPALSFWQPSGSQSTCSFWLEQKSFAYYCVWVDTMYLETESTGTG